jgi:Putative transposase, YhgA-like
MTEQDDERIVSTETLNDDYDSPWKDAVEHYFPEFIAFYFPEAYAEVDWSKEPVFLDQELRAVVQDAELGKRFVDKLVRVTVLNGDENWIYIHLEVQGTKQAEFAERMFVYNYRIYDRYDRPVASMAVLADEHERWKPTSYGFEVLGSLPLS